MPLKFGTQPDSDDEAVAFTGLGGLAYQVDCVANRAATGVR
jgi:hypothetical protein